jgi:hypothetical protein
MPPESSRTHPPADVARSSAVRRRPPPLASQGRHRAPHETWLSPVDLAKTHRSYEHGEKKAPELDEKRARGRLRSGWLALLVEYTPPPFQARWVGVGRGLWREPRLVHACGKATAVVHLVVNAGRRRTRAAPSDHGPGHAEDLAEVLPRAAPPGHGLGLAEDLADCLPSAEAEGK